MLRMIIGALMLLGAIADAMANVRYQPPVVSSSQHLLPAITITGEIRAADVAVFQRLVRRADQFAATAPWKNEPGGHYSVLVDTPGGSVDAAIAIGRLIRETDAAEVAVPQGAMCVSACVLILAGGNTRSVKGKVGIHRPYLMVDPNVTPEAQKRQYTAIGQAIKSYFESVNVPTSLYDAMFRTPPEDVHFLTEDELQTYNLGMHDPFYLEAIYARFAQRYGLTKVEVMQRVKQCKAIQEPNAFRKCLIQPAKNT